MVDFLNFFNKRKRCNSFAVICLYLDTCRNYNFLCMKHFQNGGCSNNLPKILGKINFCGNHPKAQTNHLKHITDLKKVVSRKHASKFAVCVATTAWRGSASAGELRNYCQYLFQTSGLYFRIV